MDGPKIEVSTVVPASPAQAFDAFTDPGCITRWNFASDDWHCPSAEVELVVGGRYTARMEAKDGSFGFDFEGEYREVDPPRAVTLVLADGRSARTRFEPVDGATRVTTSFDPDEGAPHDLQRDGWQAILDNFRAFVSARGAASR